MNQETFSPRAPGNPPPSLPATLFKLKATAQAYLILSINPIFPNGNPGAYPF